MSEEPSKAEIHQHLLRNSDIDPDSLPKNVSEQVLGFLREHPNHWFTDAILAAQLEHTPSGIRNAITKLKSTLLVKTQYQYPDSQSSLAYRAYYTADDFISNVNVVNPTTTTTTACIKKPLAQIATATATATATASRKCNGCGTTTSRYWRSDLEEKNCWLCNNCGMNQRRGRGIFLKSGGVGPSSQLSQEDYQILSIAPSAESTAAQPQPHPQPIPPPCIDPLEDQNDDYNDDNYYPSMPISTSTTSGKRRPPNPSYVDPSKRKCAHCLTTKSAGKWRRDREFPDRYLCNKCGMNQRRTQMRAEQQQQHLLKQKLQLQQAAATSLGPETSIVTRTGRHGKLLPCNLCQEKLPTFIADCTHRMCGECVPAILHRHAMKDEMVACPICPRDVSLIPVLVLGGFLDSLLVVEND